MDLPEIKKSLERAKTKKANLEGRKQTFMQNLKKLGIKSVKEGKTKREKLLETLEKKQKLYQKKLTTFNKKYSHLL